MVKKTTQKTTQKTTPKKKAETIETHILTVTVHESDHCSSGDDYMRVESDEKDLPEDPALCAVRHATELSIAAGILIGAQVKDTSELVLISSPIMQAFIMAATKRLEESHPVTIKSEALALKLGISAKELQEMQDLLKH